MPVGDEAARQFAGEVVIPLEETTALVVVPVPCTVLEARNAQQPTPRSTPILGKQVMTMPRSIG